MFFTDSCLDWTNDGHSKCVMRKSGTFPKWLRNRLTFSIRSEIFLICASFKSSSSVFKVHNKKQKCHKLNAIRAFLLCLKIRLVVGWVSDLEYSRGVCHCFIQEQRKKIITLSKKQKECAS